MMTAEERSKLIQKTPWCVLFDDEIWLEGDEGFWVANAESYGVAKEICRLHNEELSAAKDIAAWIRIAGTEPNDLIAELVMKPAP